jgi:antitoxin HigA-1
MVFAKRATAEAGKGFGRLFGQPHPPGALAPMHPGELLREVVLPELKTGGTTRAKFAELLGLSRSRFYDLLDEKAPVTPDLAVLIGKLCGNGPELWLNLQQRWDLARARERLADRIAELPTLKGAEAVLEA